MIDEELMSKFDRIQDLPVSEEILGAYFEGSLNDSESIEVSSIIDTNPDLSYISFEVGGSNPDFEAAFQPLDEEFVSLDFGLPEIDEFENCFQIHQPANGIDFASICKTQLADDMFVVGYSDTDVIPEIDNNNALLHDSFDMDSQSLDSDSNSGTNDDMLNENLDYRI